MLKVINNSQTFSEDPIHHLGFEAVHMDLDVFIHLDHVRDKPFDFSTGTHYLLDLETPNRWIHEDTRADCYKNEERYDFIFSIDPFLVKKRNEQLGKEKYIYSFFPFDGRRIPPQIEKKFDVFYSGHAKHGCMELISCIDRYRGCIVSNNYRNSVSYKDKILLNSASKISIVHNKYILPVHQAEETKKLNCTEVRNNTVTQHKARVVEAAMCDSIMLCERDEFNIIEDLFEEGKDFLYFDDEVSLKDRIDSILSDYENYKTLAVNAKTKAVQNYTTEAFVRRYLSNA
jgi:spore maturation protein CgeB